MINKNLVLIADRIKEHNNKDISCKTFEKISDNYFNDLYGALNKISEQVYHYQSPKNFLDNLGKHKNDFIISIWSGENSRNRKSLVPSICEAYNLMYLGADCYVHTISQDKNLSKIFCHEVDILTPRAKLLFDLDSLDIISELQLPLIVKPNFEGGSIGISQENLVYTYEDAKRIIKQLFNIFNQPILVEEFIDGDEISFVVAGDSNNLFLEAVKFHSDEVNLKNHIMSYEFKKLNKVNIQKMLYTDSIPNDLIEKVKKLYYKLDKVDLIRIDGRIKNNKFYCIELTPDVSLGSKTTVAKAFQLKGFSYSDALETIINLSIQSGLCRNANMK